MELLKATFQEERDQLEAKVHLLQGQLTEAANQSTAGAELRGREAEQRLRLAKDSEARLQRHLEEQQGVNKDLREENRR